MKEEEFLDVAAAILDGTHVSWDTLAVPQEAGDRDLLGRLRQLADVTRLHRAQQPSPGTPWGSLVIVERIGSGTFGEVYRASDPALDRDVALKLLRSPTARRLTEGQLLARVRHPNVVTVFGAAEHGGAYGIWMEFVRGRTLAQLVADRGPFAVAEVAAIGIDVCRALAAVHASGLLHGDIKAQNVMREDSSRIVLMDFGTGRIAEDDSMAAVLAGTPLYLAPEILNGGRAEATSDIYAIGVLLHFLLTGAFPLEGRTLSAIRAAHSEGLRVPVRQRRPDVPRGLADVIDRAVAPSGADRMQSAEEFEAAIIASTEAVRAASRRWWATGAAVGVLCAMGAAAALAWRGIRPEVAGAALRVRATTQEVTLSGGGAGARIIHRFDSDSAGLVPRAPARVEDLDSDGDAEIMVGVVAYEGLGDRSVRHGELLNMSSTGEMRWRFGFGDVLRFRDETASGPWMLSDWQAGPAASPGRVAVAAHDQTWWASIVAILDHQGRRIGNFVNPGWIESLVWLGQTRLAIGGFNNARDEAVMAVLDADSADGQAPGTMGTPFACLTCAPSPPLFYAAFPRSELNRVTGSPFNRARVSIVGDQILATTTEMNDGPELAIYEFDRDLRFLRARYSDSYWVMHRKLEQEGRITHARAACPERDGPLAIHVWSGSGWTRIVGGA